MASALVTVLSLGLLTASATEPGAKHELILPDISSLQFTNGTGRFHHVPEDPFKAVEAEYQRVVKQAFALGRKADELESTARQIAAVDATDKRVEETRRLERIEERKINALFDKFLERYPGHTRARLMYCGFLRGHEKPDVILEHLETARKLDPDNGSVLTALAHHHAHSGALSKAFECYQAAINLNPYEPAYYQDFAVAVMVYRKDARHYFQIEESEVFDRAIVLYDRAVKLDPDNYSLAYDAAETFFSIRPIRPDAAIQAWIAVLKSTDNPAAWEGAYLNLARIEILAKRFDDARRHLDRVQLPTLAKMKERVKLNLERREKQHLTAVEQDAESEDGKTGASAPVKNLQ